MENSADALKIAFAVFMFVIALSIVFFQLSKLKDTADSVLFYSDKTNYYSWTEGEMNENGRIVGIETVISALNRQVKESLMIQIDGETYEPTGSAEDEEKREQFIKDNLSSQAQYCEQITEITTSGEYKFGEDGTKITIHPGTTKTYVIYTKI